MKMSIFRHSGMRKQIKIWALDSCKLRVELLTVNGHLHVEFLVWLWEVERFFEAMKVSEDRQVKIVAYKLKGGAVASWNNVHPARY